MSESLGQKFKELQDEAKKKADELKKAAEGGAKGVKEKADELIEKAKQKLDAETIKQIKEIVKKIKEITGQLPINVPIPEPLQQLIKKIDEKLEALDPPGDAPEVLATEMAALVELIDEDLKPLMDLAVEQTIRDADLYGRRFVILCDLLSLVERDLDRLPDRVPPRGPGSVRSGSVIARGDAVPDTVLFALTECVDKALTIPDGVADPTGGALRFCYKFEWDRGAADHIDITWTKRDGSTFSEMINGTTTKESSCQCDKDVGLVTLHAYGGNAQVKRKLC